MTTGEAVLEMVNLLIEWTTASSELYACLYAHVSSGNDESEDTKKAMNNFEKLMTKTEVKMKEIDKCIQP